MALMILSVAAMIVPSLAQYVHSPAAGHEIALSRITAVVLLLVFAASIPASLRREDPSSRGAAAPTMAEEAAAARAEEHAAEQSARWPVMLAVAVLSVTGVLAAYVSDLFVDALQPALGALHISQAFAGLVIVAIAGNAVENVAGLVLAYKRRADLAISVVKNSVAQIAAFLFPLLVLISFALSTHLTFALAPVYIGALALSALVVWQVTGDGEAAAFEGWALVAMYVIMATLTLYE